MTTQSPTLSNSPSASLSFGIPLFAALALTSVLAFALRALLTKASAQSLPFAPLLLTQSLFALPMLAATARYKGMSLKPAAVPLHLYLARIFWGLATLALLLGALRIMPAALASTLGYTAPLFVALLAPALLGERNSKLMVLLTLVGFVGVALNAAPLLGHVESWMLGVGLLSGLSGALLQISLRKLASAGESGVRSVFWMQAAGVPVGLAACAVTGQWSLTPLQLVVCFGISALSTIAQSTNASAYSLGRALPVNALSLLTLPLTALLALLFLGEHLSWLQLAGMAVLLPSCFALVWCERLRLRKAHDAKDLAEGHAVTAEELAEEHVQQEAGLAAGTEPLYASPVTPQELLAQQLRRQQPHRSSEDH